jgi:hypothetical protein
LYWDSFKFRLPKIPAVAFITTMTMEKLKTDNGWFLVPHFERTAPLTRTEADVFIVDARSRAAQWRHVIAEDLMDATADDIVDTPAEGPFDGEPVAEGTPTPAQAAQYADEEPF